MPFVVILSGHLTLAFGTQAKSSALHNPPLYSEQTAPVHRVLYAHQWPLASPFSSSAYPALPKSGEASSQVGGKAGDIHGDAIQGEEKEGDAMMAESEERIVEVHTSSSGHRVGRGKDQ
ncbi:hypothetical protein M9H77_01815 [Catharanthus roseus]|uniref:Uncharacterized protein n=1 Tax=Catharanthus roseus TaxID=4058 RepID=A0ACC0C6J8_CATRO|nr:hypothetical protein M9H77_01815 [Catharanthus roseus]